MSAWAPVILSAMTILPGAVWFGVDFGWMRELGRKSKRPPEWEVVSTRGDGAGVLLNRVLRSTGRLDVRLPRRVHPAGVRPAAWTARSVTCSCVTSRAPATWPRATPTSPAPGVAMVTSGPAATNLVTPLMDAYMDSIPMVAITGQVPTGAIGTDAFQECDTIGITRSCTKHNELVMTAEDIPMAVRQAFHIAQTGRPGPTLIDVPKDCLTNDMTWHWPSDDDVLASLPGYRPNVKGHPRMIKEAARLILASERPVIYAGGGILKARAAEALRELAELTDSLRRHHADGPRRVPRRPPAVPRHARHARQRHRRHVDAAQRPADRPRMRASTTASPARSTRSLRTPRSSTSTSTRPNRARSAGPTCRSSATPSTSSRRSSRRSRTSRTAARCRPTRPPGRARSRGWREQFPMTYEQSEPGEALKPQFCIEQLQRARARRTRSSRRASASTRCTRRSSGSSTSPTPGSTPVASARWASRSPRRSAPRRPSPTTRCGRSTATAVSR